MNKIVQNLTRRCCGQSSSPVLDQKEEMLLAAYLDGECGWLKKIFTKRKLAHCFESRKYVDDLERSSRQIENEYSHELKEVSADISLWPRISARILQEERLSLLRAIPVEGGSGFSWFSRAAWGGLGAMAASLMFLIFSGSGVFTEAGSFLPQGSQNQISLNSSAFESPRYVEGGVPVSHSASQALVKYREEELRALQLAALHARGLGQNTSNLLSPENSYQSFLSEKKRVMAPQMFEVDWVRARGRVKVLQDRYGKAAIIWVNRPQNKLVGNR